MSSDRTDELGIEESSKQKQIRRRKLYDRLARHVVFVGGAGIILCIVAILFFIGIETVPLWKSPGKKLESVSEMEDRLVSGTAAGQVRIFDIGVDEYREQFFTVDSLGSVRFFTLEEKPKSLKTHTISHKTAGYTSFYNARDNTSYALADREGYVKPFDVSFGGRVPRRDGKNRSIKSDGGRSSSGNARTDRNIRLSKLARDRCSGSCGLHGFRAPHNLLGSQGGRVSGRERN